MVPGGEDEDKDEDMEGGSECSGLWLCFDGGRGRGRGWCAFFSSGNGN